MYRKIEYRLARLQEPAHREVLYGGLIGLEKEGLRVDVGGGIAQTPHPEALGSALTHPYITTDYSEALLEFITPPITPPESALAFLRDIHTFIYGKLKDELLWATSMPCVVKGPDAIPIARYGHSNPGIMKTVYRRGLGHRYGRVMQVIAGVHFNYSLPETFWPVYQALEGDGRSLREFADDAYMGMIRNLQRFGWLVPYLFGASPAVCKSFLCGRPTTLEEFDETTYYEPYATSLRMGDIGYQNSREQTTGMKANYDSLDAYVRSLTWAIETPCPEYEAIGVVVDGRYEQLNANILQIENEYYSTVRPKQVLEDNEKPSLALKRRGVRYVELRSLDVNAFHPLGMDESQVHFLEAFMLFCLLADSPPINLHERREIDRNQGGVAHRGRDPLLYLLRNGRELLLSEWGMEILDNMEGVCELLDAAAGGDAYRRALHEQKEKVQDPDRTPSARMLAEMRANQEGFYAYAKRMSLRHQDYFRCLTLDEERRRLFEEETQRSLERQAELEAGDPMPFEQYLAEYFAQR